MSEEKPLGEKEPGELPRPLEYAPAPAAGPLPVPVLYGLQLLAGMALFLGACFLGAVAGSLVAMIAAAVFVLILAFTLPWRAVRAGVMVGFLLAAGLVVLVIGMCGGWFR